MTYQNLRHYEKTGSRFLFNLYIPKGTDGTTEIDVLMISPKGLFVFESKNYSGWIFGNEHQKNWYQTLPQGKGRSHKEVFYNPIMQNKAHIRHLTALLNTGIPMHSIITFSERCTLKKVEVTSPDIHVIKRGSAASVVASVYSRQASDALDAQQISSLYALLYPYTQADACVKAQHIANIHKAHSSTFPEQAPQPTPTAPEASGESSDPVLHGNRCPKCGGTLVLRTARKGTNAGNQFYGCSNYPKCRYIKPISHNAVP